MNEIVSTIKTKVHYLALSVLSILVARVVVDSVGWGGVRRWAVRLCTW